MFFFFASFVFLCVTSSASFTGFYPEDEPNIYEIQKQTCELSQITMLTSTKAEEMVNKYEVCYYLNVFVLGIFVTQMM